MAEVTLKGYTFNPPVVKDSFQRRAVQFQNKIIQTLGFFGLTQDHVDIKLEPLAIKKAPASVTWYQDGHKLHYTYAGCEKYVENLAVICKLIELEVASVSSGEKSLMDFMREFQEEDDFAEQRAEARKLLGVSETERDLAVIDKAYKDKAKAAHPDMPGGDAETFKDLNKAHKTLRKELL